MKRDPVDMALDIVIATMLLCAAGTATVLAFKIWVLVLL
jgi:hypothetical protein